MPVTSPVAG